eukprot:IDg2257t1
MRLASNVFSEDMEELSALEPNQIETWLNIEDSTEYRNLLQYDALQQLEASMNCGSQDEMVDEEQECNEEENKTAGFSRQHLSGGEIAAQIAPLEEMAVVESWPDVASLLRRAKQLMLRRSRIVNGQRRNHQALISDYLV